MLAAVLVAVLTSVAVGGVWIGAAVVARHRAQTAADLAALAAAGRLPAGPEAACREARALAEAMRVTLADCTIDGLDVVVITSVRVGVGGGWADEPARAAARAGPAAARG